MSNQIIVDSYLNVRFISIREYKGTCLGCKEPMELSEHEKPILCRIIFENDDLFLVYPYNANLLCPHCYSRVGNMQIWKKESEERKEE